MTHIASGKHLRRVFKTLIHQFALYGQLAGVEWKEEQARLIGMLVSMLLGFAFFTGLLFVLTSIVLMFSWDTPHRNWAIFGLLCFYGLGIWFAWYRFRNLGSRGKDAFCDTREELAVDIALLRNKLDQ